MAAPDRLGKYTLRGTLGRGAMGTVYDGWDPAIDRRVAIKTVKLADAEDEETQEALARFKREAQAAGRLSHPNIVGVYDYGETEELAYIVMEFVEGRSLKSVIDQERRLPPAAAGTVMQQVLAGLAYSHARGVVHRDIKPANIMLTSEGQVKIADFGIARIESSSMTSVGTVMGTPAYMPPEQFLGEAVDARSDIYAAGVMLFHLLTGERPYEGSMTSIMQKVLNPEPPPAASARAAVPTVFDGVVAGAMAKAPGDRYASAGAFSQALKAALETAAREPDADETMVAPSRARVAEARDGTLSRAGAPAVTRDALEVTQAAPAGDASPKPAVDRAVANTPPPGRKGPPVALIGGVAAVLLLGAGGAWFALQPAAPPPARPLAPVLKPAEPQAQQPSSPAVIEKPETSPIVPVKPSAGQVQGNIRAALAGQRCAVLSLDPGTMQVHGPIGSDLEAAKSAAAVAAGELPLTFAAVPVPGLYCDGLDAVRDAAAQPDGAPALLALTINGASGRVRLADRSKIAPRVVAPRFATYFTIDYLSNDGSMGHLYPPSKAAPRPAGAALQLTGRESGGVGPPFGTDVVIAIASAQPLLTYPRPKTETIDQYLGALKAAVSDAKAQGAATAGGVIVVDTAAK